jgi:hypothetical protein
MLKREAMWIGRLMAELPPHDLSPMLNIGSSTGEFRKLTQPWIEQFIFAPARERGVSVLHADMKPAPEVDLVGDLLDPQFMSKLASLQFKSALCSNLLEHVDHREQMCTMIESVIQPGGFIIVTCPYRYPYHPDPIDTGYRPAPDDMAPLFKSCRVIRQGILDCGTGLAKLIDDPRKALITLARLCRPLYKPRDWWILLLAQAWLFRSFRVSYLVLQREQNGQDLLSNSRLWPPS